MKKTKQIAATVGIVILVSMYIISLIASLSSCEGSDSLFRASLFCTIAIPIVIYGMMIVYKRVHKDDKENMSVKDLRELNDRTVVKKDDKTDEKKDEKTETSDIEETGKGKTKEEKTEK